MKRLKQAMRYAAISMLMVNFLKCSSAQKLQEEPPGNFGEVYFQRWHSGIKEGTSGLEIFIPFEASKVRLDSVYFKGKVAKLEIASTDTSLYIGRFKMTNPPTKDLVLSSDAKEEYANKMPQTQQIRGFDLNPNECVVSYDKEGLIFYYKISNIKEKEPRNYPKAPSPKQ